MVVMPFLRLDWDAAVERRLAVTAHVTSGDYEKGCVDYSDQSLLHSTADVRSSTKICCSLKSLFSGFMAITCQYLYSDIPHANPGRLERMNSSKSLAMQ